MMFGSKVFYEFGNGSGWQRSGCQAATGSKPNNPQAVAVVPSEEIKPYQPPGMNRMNGQEKIDSNQRLACIRSAAELLPIGKRVMNARYRNLISGYSLKIDRQKVSSCTSPSRYADCDHANPVNQQKIWALLNANMIYGDSFLL